MDPEDYERLNKHKWHAVNGKHTYYAERVTRVGKKRNRMIIKMHREIIRVGDGKFCDHINHNGLDNRKTNLRPATQTENNRNRRKLKINNFRSKYKGVTWNQKEKGWAVRIMTNRKSRYVGCYKDEIEAAKAYDRAAKKYHGEFAVLNFESKKSIRTQERKSTRLVHL